LVCRFGSKAVAICHRDDLAVFTEGELVCESVCIKCMLSCQGMQRGCISGAAPAARRGNRTLYVVLL
jgi:hypothetical protein